MFTKFFILLLVGCTVTSAHSEQKSEHALARLQTRGIFGTLGSWAKKATDIVTYPYRKVYNVLLQTGQGFADFGSEKIQQVLQKYHNITSQYQYNLHEIKNEIIRRAIGELQGFVNILADKAKIKTCEEIKQSNEDLAESGKAALDKLEQDLQDAVDAELKNFQDQLDDWQVEADKVVKENTEKKAKN